MTAIATICVIIAGAICIGACMIAGMGDDE